MAKEIVYRKIYGCPKHGSKNGAVLSLKQTVNGKETRKPCFKCDTCNRVYLEPSSGVMGDTKRLVAGKYKIWNTVGPLPLPSEVYVYEKNAPGNLCGCKGSIKEKTKTITHFLLKNGDTESAPGVKVCKECHKVFMTQGTFEAKRKLFESVGIRVVYLNNNGQADQGKTSQSEMTDSNQGKEEKKAFSSAARWEEELFQEEIRDEDNTLEELKPAEKIASAYYDAKISYNAYQYLPWLKMYINNYSKLLISDEVGLGKTIEAGILMMEELTENVNAKILVICPAFLREKWYQELTEKFLFNPQLFDGKTMIDSMSNIVILPISRLKQYMNYQQDVYRTYDLVIVDEVHYFKNSGSIRYGYLKQLLSQMKTAKLVFMSATPVNNSGNDYQSIERLFGGKPEKTNTTKREAYIDLPERHIHDVFVDLNPEEQKLYDTTDSLDPFMGTVYRHIGSCCLYALGKYAYSGDEISSDMKTELREAMELIDDDSYSGEYNEDFELKIREAKLPNVDTKLSELKKVIRSYETKSRIVIFTHYIEAVKYLFSELSKEFSVGYVYANNISNNIPCKHIKNRFEDAKEWFSGKFAETVILICSDSCREGIDLDIANILINYDLPFNPSILEQRIGRIDRMNQKNNMEIYNFHVNNTYDDRLHFILSTKLRFINFYADYGVGNPLNIVAGTNFVFDNFIRYFGKKITDGKDSALMSNDDFMVAGRLLRQIGIKLENKAGMDALHMQAIILDKLRDNRKKIEGWFEEREIQSMTREQLVKQKTQLEQLLSFPPKIQRRLEMDEDVRASVVQKANANPQFRKRISALIAGYDKKLYKMEVTGLPMRIDLGDIRDSYVFGTEDEGAFIQSSVIELMRNEGAKIYELN